jgi:DNA polymerase-3 subunit beta
VERKNTLPILSHFLLTAQGDETIIHATDLELGYKGYLDTTVNKPGTATLPARKTYDILRELPAGSQVTLTVELRVGVASRQGLPSLKSPVSQQKSTQHCRRSKRQSFPRWIARSLKR